MSSGNIKIMRIQLKAKGFELTPSLTEFTETKLGSLEKFIKRWDVNDSVIIRIELAKTTQHHHKGNVFYAEANLDLPHRVLRVEETATDIHAAIETLKDRLKNELLRVKEKDAEH